MPKAKKSRCTKIKDWIETVGDNYLSLNEESVYCSACHDKEVKMNKLKSLIL